MNIPLSILEFGFIKPPKLYAHETINSIFEEITVYEELGYKRYWLSEHYSREFAWFSPEMLMPLLAGYSNTIKIGWAGVLLKYHNPLHIANNFKLMSAIFDGRIDLGVAPAFVAEKYTYHLDEGKPWPEKLKTLMHLLRNEKNEELGTHTFTVPPHGTAIPSPWYLGSSGRSFQNALDNKMNAVISFMHPGSNFTSNLDTIKIFKDNFYKRYEEEPLTGVLVSCVHTESKRKIKVLERRYQIEGFSNIFGSKAYIQDKLHEIQSIIGNDEFILFSPVCDRTARVNSYRAIISQN